MKQYYVYILGSDGDLPVLYVGVTNNLLRRVHEHKEGIVEGFTNEHSIKKLVYYEECNFAQEAILREKRLKHWKRDWKIQLIEKTNPQFRDLYYDLLD